MKPSRETALRWRRQAEHDLAIAPGRILDQYYIPTRYPDALAPPALPFESYTEEQGARAGPAAAAMLAMVATNVAP